MREVILKGGPLDGRVLRERARAILIQLPNDSGWAARYVRTLESENDMAIYRFTRWERVMRVQQPAGALAHA